MKGQEKGCDREGGEPRAAEDKRQTPGKNQAPLDQPMPGKKKEHEKDRKRILGEQFNDAPEKGEAREAHRLSRMLAGRGIWEQEEGTLSRIPEKKNKLWMKD